jgi:adenylate cyclase
MDRRQALARGQNLTERTIGVTLFADISGFTPLTAALTQELGRQRGAEEVLRQINPVYEALITELHRYRGAVISFAGDSITCWFDENIPAAELTGREQPVNAAARALTCALAMQRAMGQFATVVTAAGAPISIAVKIALAHGPARRFAVGDPDIQLIDALVGTTLDRVAAVERLAEKGEIVASAELIAVVGEANVAAAAWRQPEDAAGRDAAVITAYHQPVAPDPWPTLPDDALPLAQTKSWLLPPVYDRLQGGGGFLGELRPAVALFLKFSGLDYDQDDQVGAKLDAYIRWVQSVLARYEGYLLQLTIGDKGSYLYAAFGAPLAHDDDAPRAVAAALDLRTPPPALQFVADIRIGLSQGRMWTGACGATARRTYGVMGAETNMAARLMSRAEAGQILASQRLTNLAGKNYYFNYLGLMPIKGKVEPLPISEVLGRQTALPLLSLSRYTTPLVGRDDMLAEMTRILGRAAQDRGQILAINGVTGIGKSHLAAAFCQSASERGWRVAVGHCLSINQGIAYMPWRQIFYHLFDLTTAVAANTPPEELAAQVEALVREMNPDWLVRLPLLGDLLGLPIADNPATAALDGRLRQESLFALAAAMLSQWASQQPLLLLLEDVHWLDDVSQALTTAVGRAIGNQPALLCLTRRPDLSGAAAVLPGLSELPYTHPIDLPELSPAAVAALAANRLSGDLAPIAQTIIAAKTEGNPFFVEELLDSLRESGGLVLDQEGRWAFSPEIDRALFQAGCLLPKGDGWELAVSAAANASLAAVDLGIPDSIQGVVLSRLDRLTETQKMMLKVASVVGQRFELNLTRLAHPPARPEPEVALHRIQEIEARDFVHLASSGQTSPVYAFRHNTTQEVAYATLLFEQRRQLHRAVCEQLTAMQPDNAALIAHHAFLGEDWSPALKYDLLAGRQARKIFANKEAVTHLRRAQQAAVHLPAADVRAERLEIAILLGEILVQLAQYEEATAELETGLLLAEETNNDGAYVELCRWLARRWELAGQFDEAQQWIERGLSRRAGRDSAAAAELLATAGFIHSRRGNQDRAQQLAESALAMAERLQELNLRGQAHNLLGHIARLRGASETALQQLQAGLALYEAAGNLYGAALSHNQMANAYFGLGRWTDAADHYEIAQQIFERLGAVYDRAMAENNLGQLALYRGAPEQALLLYQSALTTFQQGGKSLYVLGVVEMNLGSAYIDLNQTAAAAHHLQTAAQYFEQAGVGDFLPELHRHLAMMQFGAGRLDLALQEGETAVTLARQAGMKADEGIALRVIGQIQQAQGRLAEATATLQASLDILTQTDDRYETEQARAALTAAGGN